ncbi:hypothetical protein [Nitrospira sp. Nam80]
MPESRSRKGTRTVSARRAEGSHDKRLNQQRRFDAEALQAGRMIVEFMKTSARVEHYLQKKRPLTDLQYDSIATTVEGLRTFLLTWRTHFHSVK